MGNKTSAERQWELMNLEKIISKSRDGNRMEIIARDDFKNIKTLHVHRSSKGWRYCIGYKDDQPISRQLRRIE